MTTPASATTRNSTSSTRAKETAHAASAPEQPAGSGSTPPTVGAMPSGAEVSANLAVPSNGARPEESTGEGIIDHAKNAAASLVGQARAQIESQIDTTKDEVVERAEKVVNVVRGTGTMLGGEDYASQAADQIERLTGYVRSRSIGEMVDDVNGFAREQPALFFGGSFALGIITARFLKLVRLKRVDSQSARPSNTRGARAMTEPNSSEDETTIRSVRTIDTRASAAQPATSAVSSATSKDEPLRPSHLREQVVEQLGEAATELRSKAKEEL